MTLRTRLVLALLALAALGLVVFGVVTYQLYARSEFDQLDDRLRATSGLAAQLLAEEAGLSPGPADGDDGAGTADNAATDAGDRTGTTAASTTAPRSHPPGGPPVVLPSGTYAELREADGTVTSRSLGEQDARPDLPDELPPGDLGRPFTVDSTSGSTEWRVLAHREPQGATSVVATPTSEVERSLDRLVLIEAAAAVGLLVVLACGSWLILRRGLSPLERMATTARSITAGNLGERVDGGDSRTEVGELGLALNTMLDDLEGAFAERDATEARLRQFLADASHELRTPLTSIHGFAELFRLGPDAQVDMPVILRRIEEESERMQDLVEDLLLLARLDQTRPVAREPVDLAVLAADACSDAVALDHGRPVTLSAPEPVVVRGDRDHLRQAIGNLVANAVQHTPSGTPVEVSAHPCGGGAEVVVRDHGPGLPPDAADHAFERFWRADSARTGPGSGLGLSIVAAIAEEHGGRVAAVNADGGGARFTLRVPIDGDSDRNGG
jgi:two-component system OmpR family sensor kinase